MLANYVIDEYKFANNLYGFAHKNKQSNNLTKFTKFYFDIKTTSELELNINLIKPNIIIHLAGISSSIDAFNNPISCLELNGFVVANICNIIHKNKWSTKLFNASSSEMYKGHVNYSVSENDNNFYHNHPYSIAKIMGHSIVDFYRNNYNLPFSNGIIFMTESKLRSDSFLLKKVSLHAQSYKKT
jgi:GDP-D-mannose dehydratase